MQAAVNGITVSRFVSAPTLEFDLNQHFKFFILLEIGDRQNNIKKVASKLNLDGLYTRVQRSESVFELSCYLELFMASQINQRILKTDPNPARLAPKVVSDFYTLFANAYRKVLSTRPEAEFDVF